MNRILLILVLFSSFTKTTIAQEKDETKCSIRIFSESTKSRVNSYLNRKSGFINLIFAKDCRFKNDSIFIAFQSLEDNEKIESCENIIQTVDSIIIELDNGLSWNLKSGLPKKPKRFYFRIFTKKGRENQEVIDRIHFLEFCSQFDSLNDSPCILSDTYKVYTQIKYKEKAILRAVYDVDLKSKQIEIKKLEKISNNY